MGGSVPLPPITPKDIALDFSDLTEPAESVPDDEDAADYGDYVENTTWATTVRITFDGDTAIVTGNPTTVMVSVEGAHVTVTSAAKHVRYIVKGTTPDGSLKFYSQRKFQLQLDSVDITNPHGAAINNQCGKSLYLVLNAGKVNTLRDGEEYAMVEGEDQKAALFSEGQILVSGKGRLDVYSVGKHCVASDDYIVDEGYARLLKTIEKEYAQTEENRLPDIVFFHSSNVVTNGVDRVESEAPQQPISVIGQDDLKRWRSQILGYVWNKLYRRAFLEEHQCCFRDGICEDELFNYELFLHEPHFLVTDADIYRYEQNNPRSIIHTNDHNRQRKQMADLENVIGIMNEYLMAHDNDDFAMGVKQSNCRLLKTYHKKAYKAHLSHSEWCGGSPQQSLAQFIRNVRFR